MMGAGEETRGITVCVELWSLVSWSVAVAAMALAIVEAELEEADEVAFEAMTAVATALLLAPLPLAPSYTVKRSCRRSTKICSSEFWRVQRVEREAGYEKQYNNDKRGHTRIQNPPYWRINKLMSYSKQ
jgi:hypothetical protein